MRMYEQFKTNPALEQTGIELDYGDFRITIARARYTGPDSPNPTVSVNLSGFGLLVGPYRLDQGKASFRETDISTRY